MDEIRAEDAKQSPPFQMWIEKRTLAEVLERYKINNAVRKGKVLHVLPSRSWQRGYFLLKTTMMRIGEVDFLDYSTCLINEPRNK